MSVKETASPIASTQTITKENIYQSLFEKIHLTPVTSLKEIGEWQSNEAMAEASTDERVSAAIQVLLSCIATSGNNIEKLDKSLLDFHISELDRKISAQLDAVMHHSEFKKVESLWRGTWSMISGIDFRKNVKVELLDVSKQHLREDFDDAPEIIQSGLYRHTYIEEYDTPGGEPIASVISSYEFDNSPQDIALLRNISRVAAASHMPFIGAVGPAFFRDGDNLGVEEFEFTSTASEFTMMPVIEGAKQGGVLQVVIGAVALVAAFFTAGASFAAWAGAAGMSAAAVAGTTTALTGLGLSMMLGGVVQMLTPQPKINVGSSSSADNKPNYAFGAPVNTVAMGYPVPLLYGQREIGGAIISAGLFSSDQQ